MKKGNISLNVNADVIEGPRGLSIKELKYKETLVDGSNVYNVIREDNNIIGEIVAKKGEKGNTGEKGDTGRGISSVTKKSEIDEINYYEILYTDGTTQEFTVEDGYNAHQVAVKNGYEGTEGEWLLSLVGSSGPQGEKGEQGIGISDISFKEDLSNGDKVYTITLDNGNTHDFTTPMGPKGTTPDLETLKKEIEGKVSKSGDTLNGILSILNNYVEGDGVVIRNAGDIQLTRATSNPNINFKNNNVNGYVGAVMDEGIVMRSYTTGNSVILGLDYGAKIDAGYFECKTGEGGNFQITSKSVNVGLEWWKGAKINFKNDGKDSIFTGLGNQGLFIFQTSISQYPSFRMVSGSGAAYDVNIVTMNNTLQTIYNNYFSRIGGTITGATDIQGAFSANSFYSRGDIVSAGNITTSGNVTAYSDIKLKENIKPLKNSLESISKLEIVRYNWKENGKSDIGVIAQEVEKVFPEFVIEIQDGFNGTVKTIDYSKLATVSLQGIKELLNIIEDMKNDINRLKEEN